MNIAVFIATNRPYNSYAKRVVESITDKCNIYICSTENIEDSKVNFIKDNLNNGCVSQYNYLAQEINYDYAFILTDDHTVSSLEVSLEIIEKSPFNLTTCKSGMICKMAPTDIKYPNFKSDSNYVVCRFPAFTKKH